MQILDFRYWKLVFEQMFMFLTANINYDVYYNFIFGRE